MEIISMMNTTPPTDAPTIITRETPINKKWWNNYNNYAYAYCECELPSDVEVSVGEGEGEGAKTTDRLIVVTSSDVPYLFWDDTLTVYSPIGRLMVNCSVLLLAYPRKG